MFALVETYVDYLKVPYVFGEYDRFGAYGVVHYMVRLYIAYGIDKPCNDFFLYIGIDRPFVEEFSQGIPVDVVGDDTHAKPGHLFEIVDHDDAGVCQVIPHVEFLFNHLTIFGLVAQFRPQGFKHHPFAMFFCGVDLIKILIPFGKVFDFGPFGLFVAHVVAWVYRGCEIMNICSRLLSK